MEIYSVEACCPDEFFNGNNSFKLRILSRENEILGRRYSVVTDDVRFSSLDFSCVSQIKGEPQQDWVYFGVRKDIDSTLLVNKSGVARGSHSLSIAAGGGVAVAGTGFSVYSIGVRKSTLLALGVSFSPQQQDMVNRSGSYTIDQNDFYKLNQTFGELISANPDAESFEKRVLDILCTLVLSIDPDREIPLSNRYRIVYAALSYMVEHSGRRVSTRELANATHCSLRTLQYSFRTILGISPKSYCDRFRLSLFREALLESGGYSNHSKRIRDLARDYGFTHPGNFAKLYRSLFWELPSDGCSCEVHRPK